MEPPLLDYAISTSPSPLATGVDGRINLSLSIPDNRSVYCDQITVAVPYGPQATDSYLQRPMASLNTTRWRVASSAEPIANYARFTLTPVTERDRKIDFSLVLSLHGTINVVAGNFGYQVYERSGTTPDPLGFEQRQSTFILDKATATLDLRNFAAALKDHPTVPVTMVVGGQPLQLSWSSNGTWFELYAGGRPTPVYAGRQTTTVLAEGIRRDTTFFLIASMTGDPRADQAQPGYEPVVAYATLTLGVVDPTLATLTCEGTVGADKFIARRPDEIVRRGIGFLRAGRGQIALPPEGELWNIVLTNCNVGFDRLLVKEIDVGQFIVVSDNPASIQQFFWQAVGTRRKTG